MTTELAKVQDKGMTMGAKGITLGSYGELIQFAQTVAESGLAPKGMDKPAAIAIALQMAMEVGLSPMAGLQNIAVINGRPTMWGDAQLAVCRASGVFDESAFDEGWEKTDPKNEETILAYCIVRRLPDGKPVRREFSIAEARRAGLWQKQGPWTQYPKRMLQCRARSWALKDTFSDLLKGISMTEEARDHTPLDVPIETAGPMETPKRARPKKGDSPPPQVSIAQDSVNAPIADAPEKPAEPADQPNEHGLTEKQLKIFNVHIGAHDGIGESQLAQMIKDSTEGGTVNADLLDELIEKASA